MSYTAKKQRPNPTLDELVQDLELDLVLGRMRPRERLVEDELMARFGAKRHTVRSALSELEQRGLIERPQNRGARVRDYSTEEVVALYEFRDDLHQLAISRIQLPMSGETLSELTRIAQDHEAAAEQGDLVQVIALNNRFHDILFGQCDNAFLTETIKRMDAASNAIRSYRIGDPKLLQMAIEEHKQIIEAARTGNRDDLARLCRQHILPSRDMYLQDQTRRQ